MSAPAPPPAPAPTRVPAPPPPSRPETPSATELASKEAWASRPGPPSRPAAHGIGTNEATLSWALPQSFGGFALQGYCVQAQVSGDGGWKEWISHTRDVHPVATVTKLAPTSWYEFRVAAINVNGAGSWSETSEPILTLASHVSNHGKVQRRRRTMQTGGPVVAAARKRLEESREPARAAAEELALSELVVRQWETDWAAQHSGQPPSRDERDQSHVLSQEAEIQLALRHTHAVAAVAVSEAEVALTTAQGARGRGSN